MHSPALQCRGIKWEAIPFPAINRRAIASNKLSIVNSQLSIKSIHNYYLRKQRFKYAERLNKQDSY